MFSGAGDTVIAVLTAAIAAGGSPVEAAMLANCATGVVIGKVGTATTTQQELLRSIPTSSFQLAPRSGRFDHAVEEELHTRSPSLILPLRKRSFAGQRLMRIVLATESTSSCKSRQPERKGKTNEVRREMMSKGGSLFGYRTWGGDGIIHRRASNGPKTFYAAPHQHTR